MKIVFFGTPEFAVSALKSLIDSGYEVSLVVTQPDRQSGRGRKVKACPVKVEAQNAGITVLQPQKVRDADFISELKRLSPDVIVVVAYGQIFPAEIINMPKFGCVNIHASLLPKYRGAAPINQAIINGEKETGISTMLMDEGMDTGPVLLKETTEIVPEDTAGSLSLRLSNIGGDLIVKTLRGLADGTLKSVPQDEGATYASLMNKTDGLIQWSKSAEELSNLVRGMNPWPGAYGFIDGQRYKILKAVPVEGEGEPGVIVRATKDELHVSTGHGALSILEIQPSGKPAMPIHSLLQGRRLKEGMRFDQ